MIRGLRRVDGKRRASGQRVMFRRATGRARAALERLAAERKRARRKHARTRPGRKSRGLRRAIPRRVSCAFPTAPFARPITPRSPRRPRKASMSRSRRQDQHNDASLTGPMLDDIARRYGRTPDRLLVDTSYATSEDIVALAAHAAGPVSVYTPPPNEKETVKPASLARRRSQSERRSPPASRQWRERMASEAGIQANYALPKRSIGLTPIARIIALIFLAFAGSSRPTLTLLWHALANKLVAAHRLRVNTPEALDKATTLAPSPPEPPSPQARATADLRWKNALGTAPNTRMQFLHRSYEGMTLGKRQG